MAYIVDRRDQHKDKSSTSRERFIHRHKAIIKQAAADAVRKAKGFTDLADGHSVSIDRKSLDEPTFTHGPGGDHEFILSGNDQYGVGERIGKPRGGAGQGGSQGSPDGEGEDAFTFHLDRDEFLRLILEDLALPDMVKKNIAYSVLAELVHAGFSRTGSPGQMDVQRSFKVSLARRIGLKRKEKKGRLLDLEDRLGQLDPESEEAEMIRDEIAALRAKLRTMPFFDPNNDLRYRLRELERKPSVSAVMFCVMDVSGSMTENMKAHAKWFYMLLYLFLQRNYNHIDVVFVRHTSTAQEVDEETFFYDRETGGTIVSSALELVSQIIKARYDASVWNIYIAQVSDGDNYSADSARCQDILESKLLPLTQYMVYVEMSDSVLTNSRLTDLWGCYAVLADRHPNLTMKQIGSRADIYPVFRQLFAKKAD